MKQYKLIILTSLLITLLGSCAKDLDDSPISNNDINDFIYRGLNRNYLYVNNVPALVENKQNTANYQAFLNSNTPENFFESLLFDRQNTDRFSWITSDYLALEQQFQGISMVNGMEFGLKRITLNNDTVFGYVKYVLPNTSAALNNITRGMLFTSINNETLTVSNFRRLIDNDFYSIQLANYNSTTNEITPNGTSVTLTKQVYTENPVFLSSTFTVDTETVGYLVYNSFTPEFNSQLNAVFANFNASGIDQLVLDLRYNPGGSVNTATLLASMITGQFNGQIASKLNYNFNLSSNNRTYNFTNSFNGQTVNSLNLPKVYVLTTSNTASASEMIINSLKPYIDVVQIGTNSTGKSQASITLYDSPNFRRANVNPSHLYAMQPLVAITANVNDEVVPGTGIVPQTVLAEDIFNLGILGDQTEPLLAEAIAQIDALNRPTNTSTTILKPAVNVIHSSSVKPFSNSMYLD